MQWLRRAAEKVGTTATPPNDCCSSAGALPDDGAVARDLVLASTGEHKAATDRRFPVCTPRQAYSTCIHHGRALDNASGTHVIQGSSIRSTIYQVMASGRGRQGFTCEPEQSACKADEAEYRLRRETRCCDD